MPILNKASLSDTVSEGFDKVNIAINAVPVSGQYNYNNSSIELNLNDETSKIIIPLPYFKNQVVSGGVLFDANWKIENLVYNISGTVKEIASQALSFAANSSGFPRIDMLTVKNDGTHVITTGTPSTLPGSPEPANNELLIGYFFVPDSWSADEDIKAIYLLNKIDCCPFTTVDTTDTDTTLPIKGLVFNDASFLPASYAGKVLTVQSDGTVIPKIPTGFNGLSSFVYIAYASDDEGTDFSNDFDDALDYIAIKTTTTAITSPTADDFVGLWKRYRGTAGASGTVFTGEIRMVPDTLLLPEGWLDYTDTETESSVPTGYKRIQKS